MPAIEPNYHPRPRGQRLTTRPNRRRPGGRRHSHIERPLRCRIPPFTSRCGASGSLDLILFRPLRICRSHRPPGAVDPRGSHIPTPSTPCHSEVPNPARTPERVGKGTMQAQEDTTPHTQGLHDCLPLPLVQRPLCGHTSGHARSTGRERLNQANIPTHHSMVGGAVQLRGTVSCLCVSSPRHTRGLTLPSFALREMSTWAYRRCAPNREPRPRSTPRHEGAAHLHPRWWRIVPRIHGANVAGATSTERAVLVASQGNPEGPSVDTRANGCRALCGAGAPSRPTGTLTVPQSRPPHAQRRVILVVAGH